MDGWTKKRSRQFVTLALITTALVLSGALAAYADSADHYLSMADPAQASWAAVSGVQEGAESAMLGVTTTTTPTVAPPTTTPTPIPSGNVIVNGGFEDGFVEGQGVGVGWGRFQNGNVFAGWYDDTWSKVVYEGEHAQLVELTNSSELDRYAGIFQTVTVVPNTEYVLTLHGLVRSDEGSPEASNFGYRMQYGIDFKGGTDWQSGDIQWVELPWDDQPREDLTGQNVYRMETYSATIKAQTNKLTLFIRGWKKWADQKEGNYDIDGVSLVGQGTPGAQPTSTPVPTMPETGNAFGFLENRVLVVSSAALLVVLVSGAAWGLSRRRA